MSGGSGRESAHRVRREARDFRLDSGHAHSRRLTQHDQLDVAMLAVDD